jgi:hypothetical protein
MHHEQSDADGRIEALSKAASSLPREHRLEGHYSAERLGINEGNEKRMIVMKTKRKEALQGDLRKLSQPTQSVVRPHWD